MDEIKRALEIAEQIPFRFLVQHLGTPNESFSEKKFEAAMTSIEHLRAFAKPLGVRILLENIPNELSAPDRLVEMIRGAHFDDVGVCFDFGHAHMENSVREGFEILRSHICSTHVHDNDKIKTHTCGRGREPSTGKKPWNCCDPPRKPRRCCWKSAEDEKVNPLEKLAETFDKLETA